MEGNIKQPQLSEKTQTLFENMPTSALEAVDAIFDQAVRRNASDIHIDPRESDILVRFRVDGELELAATLSKSLHDELISRVKILSEARTDIHAVPQDGRYRTKIRGEDYNVRVSFMPTSQGENVVARLLPASISKKDSFSALGFTPDHVRAITSALSKPNGLILVTGPTGSGKTTTLRVCLGIKSKEPLSVLTLEDPVEYEVPGVRHIHIRETYGVTFAAGLRSALRQDPDVIMVGEIRDSETARTAVQTALTGHLVLSSLHTSSALETILRLLDMGVEGYLIAATVRLIVSQRLVRCLCEDCSGVGFDCSVCLGSGFYGRSVISEVLEIDNKLRELIAKGESQKVMLEYAISQGFHPIRVDASEKVEWGVTTEEEVVRALNT